ncbi:MAG: phosphatidic acid phosphatase [Ruminococcus sp.]|nr:phosphatidic acid phosphatase [Ruminococcus sp.]
MKSIRTFFQQYPHWKLLLYWPLYGLVFELLEWFVEPPVYHVMYCRLDDFIPFSEIFIVPYLYWFLALIGIHVYTFFKDALAFRKLMYFVILTHTISLLMFVVYPSVQYLRPDVMPRDNVFTDLVAYIYHIDTNTNVCPSLHVVGGIAVWFASLHCRSFQMTGWRIFFFVSTVLICLSTVFLKQHSVIDIPAALCICALGYPLTFGKRAEQWMRRRSRKRKRTPVKSA